MKKVLVLASLGLLVTALSCGGDSGVGGETAANVQTAAGISSAIVAAGSDVILQTSVDADEVVATVECINYDGTIGKIDADLTSGAGSSKVEMDIIYNKCGWGLCEGHVFMDGTLKETYTVSGSNYKYTVKGIIDFIEPTAGFEAVTTYYAGKNCGIDLALDINVDTLVGLIEAGDDAAVVAYIDGATTGTVCGYDYTEAVDIDEDTYCATLNI